MIKRKTLRKMGACIIAVPLLFFVELDHLKFSDRQQVNNPVTSLQNNNCPEADNSGDDTSFPVFINSKFIVLNY